MRESEIERKCCRLAFDAGWLVYKFVSPMKRGVPDRLFIREGKVVFVEFKTPGKRPTILQKLEIERLRGEGMTVLVIDAVEDFRRAFSI